MLVRISRTFGIPAAIKTVFAREVDSVRRRTPLRQGLEIADRLFSIAAEERPPGFEIHIL